MAVHQRPKGIARGPNHLSRAAVYLYRLIDLSGQR